MRNQAFTDIHQHLLWGVDDGADSRETMYAMLREANRQGVQTIVATPHAQPGFHPFDWEECQERIAEAQSFCRRENLPVRVLLGGEIGWTYQTPLALRQRKVPTLGGTDYVLLEFWRDISWREATDGVKQLIGAGYCPVLAHPERYFAFLLSPEKTLRFRNETGALLQVNAGTFLSPRNLWERRFASYLLGHGGIDAVASDAHDDKRRPVNLEGAYRWLVRHTDETYARNLVTFSGELL